MTEPNHDLTDSEAQAFQPEPHVMHLLQRAAKGVGRAPSSALSDTTADAGPPDASSEGAEDGTSRGRQERRPAEAPAPSSGPPRPD